MASLTTGLIENTRVSNIKPCSTISVTVTNKEPIANTIRVNGYYWTGEVKKEYVLDLLTLAPGEVIIQNYYALFEAFEFHFISGLDDVEITVLGKNDAGRSTMKYNILPVQLFSLDSGMRVEVPKTAIPSALNRVYLLDPSSRRISVIDGNTHTLIGSIIVGSGPFGLGINSVTNRIYVANFASDSVSAIDGSTNQVITEITVGSNPMGVGVNPQTNRLYVTNWGSHSVSVIDGLTHTVITTVRVEAFPEGVSVNQTANLIYITNHGSNNVTVLDGSTNTIKTMVDLGH
ncbi:YncE family protein [Desulfosporosinus hippei]|uniref:40-residue YVTN family beta-propeller repeat-containing protein n=1 Tax=Desulfosporosinus hippei DSM 8344 TaxID=1121419 RepID=A0A1G8IWW8_9FIRM|nr:YncE family protein [Desulfosporosinus hippei]SDI23431.1 40-residue YVTN family beta-propeller repeat-containing protein [Desulfosporosinus hippei DSM 8344]